MALSLLEVIRANTLQTGRLWGRILAMAVCLLGAAVATGAHLAARRAEQRALQRYEQLLGCKYEPTSGDPFREIRPLVGAWGCLAVLLAWIKGVAVVIAVAAGIYVLLGPW